MSEPKISVIIPVYNRTAAAVRCVNSVLNQDFKDTEIIVVDDASADETWEALRKIQGLRLFRHEKREGSGAARNTGVAASRGRLLVFLDSDCWATSSSWLGHHLEAHQRGDNSIVSGFVKGSHHTYAGGAFSYLNWFMLMRGKNGIITAPYIPAANMSVSRELFDRIGPFDTGMLIYEDVDWSYRARAAGVPFRLAYEAWVYHEDREGLIAVWKHHQNFGEKAILLRRRHPHSPYAWLFPKTLPGAIIMYLPLAFLLTVYIIGTVVPRRPGVIWYGPGILWGHLGYCWGLIRFFLAEVSRSPD